MKENQNKKLSWKDRAKSFAYAWEGLKYLWNGEHNFRIHVAVSACVLVAGGWLNISLGEWTTLFFAIGIVLSAEAFNSSIEAIADFISPEVDSRIKRIKDISAAAVLITAVMAASIGLLVFLPKIVALC